MRRCSLLLLCCINVIYIFSSILQSDGKIAGIGTKDPKQDLIDYYDICMAKLFPTCPPYEKLSPLGKQMVDAGIIPTYMPVPPSKVCEVIYPWGEPIEPGEEQFPQDIQNQPMVFWESDEKRYYALTLLNIDRCLVRDYPWFVINIPGGVLHKGRTIRAFASQLEPGRNRHVFLIFEQEYKINSSIMEKDANIHRIFYLRNVARTYGLGNPIAGNFFVVPMPGTRRDLYHY